MRDTACDGQCDAEAVREAAAKRRAPRVTSHDRDAADDDRSRARKALADATALRAPNPVEAKLTEPRAECDGSDHGRESQVAVERGEAAEQWRRFTPQAPHRAERDVRPHALEKAHLLRFSTRPERVSMYLPASTAATPLTNT